MGDEDLVSEDVKAVRLLLGSWLSNPDWQAEDLIEWSQGYGLPTSRDDEDPYVWLLRGLPVTGGRFKARTELAHRLAVVLTEQPDVHRPGRRPKEVLYNLLMLAAGLSLPGELAEPLYQMYQRSVLEGEHLGLDLRHALRAALAENQIDDRLEWEWFAALESRGTAKLPGGPYQGFEGVWLMPESPATQDRPKLDALGRALKAMADLLEARSDRQTKLRELIDKVMEKYGEPEELWPQLMTQSEQYDWPDWVIECGPSGFDLDEAIDQAHERLLERAEEQPLRNLQKVKALRIERFAERADPLWNHALARSLDRAERILGM